MFTRSSSPRILWTGIRISVTCRQLPDCPPPFMDAAPSVPASGTAIFPRRGMRHMVVMFGRNLRKAVAEQTWTNLD